MTPYAELHPFVTRMVWACCAAVPSSPLSATQRESIVEGLKIPAWCPDRNTLPQTNAAVQQWYESLRGAQRQMIEAVTRTLGQEVA